MVRVIMGKKGTGKTKQMIDLINAAAGTEHGNVVCIERNRAMTFTVDYSIRLVEASDYDITSFEFLKGMISGLYAGFRLVIHDIARKLRVFVLHARKTALESLFCLVILLAFQISDAERPVALRQSVACLYGSLQHRNRRYVVLLFERLDALFIKL